MPTNDPRAKYPNDTGGYDAPMPADAPLMRCPDNEHCSHCDHRGEHPFRPDCLEAGLDCGECVPVLPSSECAHNYRWLSAAELCESSMKNVICILCDDYGYVPEIHGVRPPSVPVPPSPSPSLCSTCGYPSDVLPPVRCTMHHGQCYAIRRKQEAAPEPASVRLCDDWRPCKVGRFEYCGAESLCPDDVPEPKPMYASGGSKQTGPSDPLMGYEPTPDVTPNICDKCDANIKYEGCPVDIGNPCVHPEQPLVALNHDFETIVAGMEIDRQAPDGHWYCVSPDEGTVKGTCELLMRAVREWLERRP